MSTLQTTILKHPDSASNQVTFTSGGDINFDSGAVFIDSSSNRLGLGNSNPSALGTGRLVVGDGSASTETITVFSSTSGTGNIHFADGTSGQDRYRGYISYEHSSNDLSFATNDSEVLRIDGSQRLLVGTSSPRTNVPGANVGFLVEGSTNNSTKNRFIQHIFGSNDVDGPYLGLGKHRGTSNGQSTIVNDGDEIGAIYFQGSDGTNFKQGAAIIAQVHGTPGTNDMPGRLTFHTTADGAASPTEQLRINSIGRMTGHAVDVARMFTILYSRLLFHGGCNSNGPSASFSEFDTGENSFTTVSRTTSSAPSGYQFIGDGYGNAFTFFVGCGDNPVFSTANKDAAAGEYHAWVLIDSQFAAATGGLPLNATRTSLP